MPLPGALAPRSVWSAGDQAAAGQKPGRGVRSRAAPGTRPGPPLPAAATHGTGTSGGSSRASITL